MPEEEKKRHNMTFRLRSDLRAAIEEMAQENGRSLSEQLEYYVEAGFRDEAKMLYQYSTGGLTPAVSAFLSGRTVWKDWSHLPVKATEIVPAASSAAIGGGRQQASKPAASLAWAKDPAELEGALHMARAFLHAARKGSVEALDEMLGSEIVATALAEVVLAEAAKVNQSTRSNTGQPMSADQVASLIIGEFREIVGEARRPAEKL